MNMNVYILGLLSNFTFALGSQFFTFFTNKFSSTWVNAFKATFALFAFGFVLLLTNGFHPITISGFVLFFISGFLGLGIGDIFLLKAFGEIGPGRTLMIFGFQPIIIGFLSFILFDQDLDMEKFWAILFFIICVVIFSIETFRKSGKWQLQGIMYAFAGMFLDAVGLIITRYNYNLNIDLTPGEANFYRCLGAVFLFAILKFITPFDFRKNFKSLNLKLKGGLFLGAFLGTYVSLAFYLTAIQTAHLASLSALAITSTIFSAGFECIMDRKLPTKYWWGAFAFFLGGMYFLILKDL